MKKIMLCCGFMLALPTEVLAELPAVQVLKQPYVQSSMLLLIAKPEQYYNRNISLRGHFKGGLLYLSAEHARYGEYAIDIYDDSEGAVLTYGDCNNHWVEVQGYYFSGFNKDRNAPEGRLIPDLVTVQSNHTACWQRTEPFTDFQL